jgi:hypothetical protein
VSNCPELALQSAAECVDAAVVYPLHSAARNGHIDCLSILIDSGFDVDFVTDQGTPLHVAALFGKVAIVKLLLEKGSCFFSAFRKVEALWCESLGTLLLSPPKARLCKY